MENWHIRFPDGTKERIKALGVPGGPTDFVRWAVEEALQEHEARRRQAEADRMARQSWLELMRGGGADGPV